MPLSLSRICGLWIIPTMALLLVFVARPAKAQSTDVRFPTVVDGREIVGTIVARDIGDARLTDHFYTFNGSPGDLLISVESKNLNGDFDVFTAAELRPVLKVTVYAESSTAITKNIYLRKPEGLILRVEARSPNDDAGSYRIRFSGSFAPSNNAPLVAESEKPGAESDRQPSRGDRKTTRVSSVGARIEEPPVEVATAPTPESTPAATPEESSPSTPTKTTVRKPSGRRTPARPTRTKPAAKPAASDASKSDVAANQESPAETPAAEPAKTEPVTVAEKSAAEETKTNPVTSETPKKPATARRASGRSSRAAARETKTDSSSENAPRLVIEQKNGTHLEWPMSMIKSVTVEDGQLVVVRNDGYVERLAMSQVARMSIGP